MSPGRAPSPPPPPIPPRLRRALELAYGVEGVAAARVWHWDQRVAVGIRGGPDTSPVELLRRVEAALAGLREPEETWEFGLLGDDGVEDRAEDDDPSPK